MIKHVIKRFLPRRESPVYQKIGFWILAGAIGLFAFGMLLVATTVVVLSIGLPDVTKLNNLQAAESTEIFDKDGKLLYTIHGEENREQVDLENIAEHLLQATVAIEDDAFWEHSGFDILAIGRAAAYEIFGIGTPRGGSTITQQYVKNTFLSRERSYTRKAKELILSIRLERAYDKEQILELYLNRIPYGNNAHGVQKASEVYFAKDAMDLTVAESAILAALPQAPSRYNPFGDNKFSHLLKEFTAEELTKRAIDDEFDLNYEEYTRGLIGKHVELGNGTKIYIQGRTDLVLKRMSDLGFITSQERQRALDELQAIEFNTYRENIRHPHFVLYIKQILENRYGKEIVEQGGLKVYTTIDGSLQAHAEKVSKDQGEINAKSYGADNNAILSINAKTGHILAMVGSRDYFNEEIDGNVNVVLRPRQPGSSFKPIVYSQAFYNGYGPGNVIHDIPIKIGPNKPQNFDGKWQGQISVRRALGQSRNIPAIKMYYLAGQQKAVIELAKKMGISSLDPKHDYGYPLALGAGEVPLFEMVNAYSVFAAGGKRPEITGILRVENANGDILEEWQPKEFEEVLDPQIAYLINSILSDRSQAVGTKIFVDGKINAAKTGTSTKESKEGGKNQVRPSDGWTLGYTPTIVTGVWIGNTDGRGMNFNADGYNAAAPIFKSVMTKALEGLPAEPFPEPAGIKHVKISRASGKLPGPETPSNMIISEIFASFAVPSEVEHLFFRVKIDKVSGLLATEFTPEDAIEERVYQNYEPIADMLNWAAEVRAYFGSSLPPKEYDNIHSAGSSQLKPSVSISSPGAQSILPAGNFAVSPSISAPHGVSRVEFYIDDKLEYTTTAAPYTGYLNISKFYQPGSKHLVVTKVVDQLGYTSQAAIEIKIAESTTVTNSGPSENKDKKDEPKDN